MYKTYALNLHIMQTARFTTNFNLDLFAYLQTEAQKLKTTQRKILEEALTLYKKQKTKQEVVSSLNALADDKEEMSEWLEIANNPMNS